MRKGAVLGLVASLALVATAAGARDKPSPEAGSWDMIAFEMNSWGQPVHSWRIQANGNGSWTETVRPDGAPFNRYDQVWHELAAGEGGYASLAAILAKLPRPAPDYASCTKRITDQAYGTLRMTRGATTIEISYNAGCLDANYVAFLDLLKEADQLVAGWGREGAVLRTETQE